MTIREQATQEAERRYPKRTFVRESHVQNAFIAGAEWASPTVDAEQIEREALVAFFLDDKVWQQARGVQNRESNDCYAEGRPYDHRPHAEFMADALAAVIKTPLLDGACEGKAEGQA